MFVSLLEWAINLWIPQNIWTVGLLNPLFEITKIIQQMSKHNMCVRACVCVCESNFNAMAFI